MRQSVTSIEKIVDQNVIEIETGEISKDSVESIPPDLKFAVLTAQIETIKKENADLKQQVIVKNNDLIS